MSDLKWTTIARGRKEDGGHTLVAVAEKRTHDGFLRTFARCQCGKEFSGYGEGGMYGHNRHVRQMEKQGEK